MMSPRKTAATVGGSIRVKSAIVEPQADDVYVSVYYN